VCTGLTGRRLLKAREKCSLALRAVVGRDVIDKKRAMLRFAGQTAAGNVVVEHFFMVAAALWNPFILRFG